MWGGLCVCACARRRGREWRGQRRRAPRQLAALEPKWKETNCSVKSYQVDTNNNNKKKTWDASSQRTLYVLGTTMLAWWCNHEASSYRVMSLHTVKAQSVTFKGTCWLLNGRRGSACKVAAMLCHHVIYGSPERWSARGLVMFTLTSQLV